MTEENKSGDSGKFCFTAVFNVDQKSFEANPHLIDTHWGRPVATSVGDLTYCHQVLIEAVELVYAERGIAVLKHALDEVQAHILETRAEIDRAFASPRGQIEERSDTVEPSHSEASLTQITEKTSDV